MKILIIGGTRYIGKHLCEHLLAKKHDITVFSRGNNPIPQGVKHIKGDRKQISDFKNQLISEKFEGLVDMLPMNDIDTRPLIDIFKGAIQSTVHISSQDANLAWEVFHKGGHTIPMPLDEDSPRRTNRYLYKDKYPNMANYDKVLMEEALEEAAKEYDFPYTVLRFPKTYGEFDGQVRFQYVVKRIMDNRLVFPMIAEEMNWLWSAGYVKDLVQSIELALSNKMANQQIYNVGNVDIFTIKQEVELISKIMNVKVEIIPIPNVFWPQQQQSDLNFNQHMMTVTNKIRKELGYQEIFSLEDGFRRTIEWQTQNIRQIQNTFSYADEDKLISKYHKNVSGF